MRDITHFLLATLLSLATLACRHDTPPADGSLSRQLPPDTKEILRQLNDRDNREEALRLADSLAALPPSDDPWLEIRIAQAVANTLYKFRRDYYHVGVVMQTNPLRILHCSSGGVKADTSASRWQFHGMLTMFAGRMGLMQIGDSGDAVKGLQSALMAAGFPLPLHGADGNFGAETEQALRQFQQKSGLSASGAADAETLAALRLLNG